MDSVEKVVEDIKSVKVQGAKEIAIYSLKFLRKFCKKNGFKLRFEVAAKVLEEARPTAVVLHNCLEILKKNRKLSTIDSLLKRLESTSKKIGVKGNKLIKNSCRIMMHCHSSEALSIVKTAKKKGRNFSVITTITEPLNQGIKTAKELSRMKIPVTLIEDFAAGYFMNDVDLVIIGVDAIRKEGIVNKIGTNLIASAAKQSNKPLYVVGNMLKLDKRKKFFIEERSGVEIFHLPKMLSPIATGLKGVRVRNPAFDITPWRYITAVVTEKGILKPKQVLRLLK
jgi:ribose 1,5-bisphosphate isomerase